MKRIFYLFILVPSLIYSQTRIKSFISSQTEIYSLPNDTSLTSEVLNHFDEVYITNIVGDFYKLENYGYVKRECVFQNDDLIKFNFTIVPKDYLTLKDSIRAYVRNYTSVYSYPSTDSLTSKLLPEMTDVIVTESDGDFYKIYGYGYIQKYSVYQNDDLELFDKGMDRIQRESYKKELEQTLLKKQQERKKDLEKRFGKSNAEKILSGKVWVGMTKEMVKESWGNPEETHKIITSGKINEQWIYNETYLYFDNNVLTTIQD